MEPIVLNLGDTKTIFFYINLKGKLFYKILNQSSTDKITSWWLKGPFGSVQKIGNLINSGTLDIKGFIWGKLKASGADSVTKIYITEHVEIAAKFPDIHF